MKNDKKREIVLKLVDTFKKASQVSLDLRKLGLKKEIKEDNTPVTNGDIEVNKILIKKISELTPEILIISEENSDNKKNKDLKNFWLIDPIDGTRDYLSGREEFTINAALIIDNKPSIGIISAPAKNRIFYSYGKTNSYELLNNQEIDLYNNTNKKKEFITAVSYSDNLKNEIKEIHDKFNVSNYVKMKSSYKFCVIATGEFDLYVAEPRACEWDIAAGHAILEHAGGKVTDFDNNEILYGKTNFKNPSLIIRNKRFN